MKKYCPILALVLLGISCKEGEIEHSKVSNDQTIVEEMGVTDLSILVPLQSSLMEDPSESLFVKVGTGMCNAPTLDLGAEDPILSEALWQDWAKDTLISVLPLPKSESAWKEEVLSGGLPMRINQLKADMSALPNLITTADDLCPEPIGGQDLRTDDVETLRNEGTNVAVTQTLPAGACHYRNWRVVAARFEPCSYRPTVLARDKAALDSAKNPDFPAEACGGAELRLVIQPFIPNADGGYTAVDMAMHAFYKLNDTNEFVDDLRKFRATTKAVLAASTERDPNSVWYADQKDMLIPHPGLREEMNCLSEDQTQGPVGGEWRRILAKYARQSQLFKLTWMASDNSGGNWSFGLRVVQSRGTGDSSRIVKRGETFKVETFTISQITRGFPFTPFDAGMKSVDYFYRNGRSDRTFASDAAKTALKELIDIANPDLTSLNVGGKFGSSCASCHTRDQTEKAVRNRSGKTHEELALLAGTSFFNIPMWDPIRRNIEKRNDNNLRNFGYGPAMTLGVSRRSIHEANAVRLIVNSYFFTRQDLNAQALITVNNKTSVNFEAVKPILEARCGYCHSSKRLPALLAQPTAEAYHAAIVANVCSPVLANRHMPPGKNLPGDEKALILEWANSLRPEGSPITCESLRNFVLR